MKKRILSIVLAICLVLSLVPTMVFAEVDENNKYSPSEGVDTNRYYFYMPSDWYNDCAQGAGIYWWLGTDAPSSWPGYVAQNGDASSIYYCDVPSNVSIIIWNNAFDGGEDATDPDYAKAIQTKNIAAEFMTDVDSEIYDAAWFAEMQASFEGDKAALGSFADNFFIDDMYDMGFVFNFDNMIYVINPDMVEINDSNGKVTSSGEWYFYFGNGEYGTYPTKDACIEKGCLYNTEYQPSKNDPVTKPSTEAPTEATLRAALNEGITTIKLMADINLSSALDLSNKDITIDLNGHVISGADISINTANGKASLTLIDSNPTATHTDSTLPLGGVVTSEFNSNTHNVAIKCTSNTPTAFTGKISGYAHLYGGIYYGTIASTVTIEAKKITFKNGNDTYAYEIVDSGNNTLEPISPPVKEGYNSFDGWYNGDTKYTFGSSLSEDITLTAVFSNPKTYNIFYDLNGGTVSPENPGDYTIESESITLNNPTKIGYTFIGWSATDLSGYNMTVTIPKGSTGNRTYTANFSQNTYTVKFDTNGGSSISDKTNVKWDDTVLTGVNNPTREGFEFTGWKCSNQTVSANTKYSDLAADDTVKSVTLVAQWKDTEKPVITGLEKGKTYCDAVEFEVTDNVGIASVKAGDTVLTPGTNGKYTLEKGMGTVTVVAKDNAGNETSLTVTVNDGHTDINKDHACDYCGKEMTTCTDDNKDHLCDICGLTLSDHTGGTDTCVAKAICEYCAKEYGELDSSNHNLEKISANVATVTQVGNTEYWHCKDCAKYFADEKGTNEIKLEDTVITKLPPEIIDGKGQSITEGEVNELTFRSNALFSDFIRVELDGVTVVAENYTAREGSTIITLKAEYVATLSAGEHTIGIISKSGTANTTFTVNAKAVDIPKTEDDTTVPTQTDDTTVSSQAENKNMKSPQTGNDGETALWLALLLSCGGAIIVTGAYGKRKKHSVK